ncbi:transporter YIP1 [Ascoidea rubescens DSM 1968]|uniref:Yip1-domain-containing protein n=1 Tax=Ascoidea rubescens DSM 1968 TaxID=1344418 RepID=A0A1D2VA75_9ASCO|nr:Yip1-domain-containing protein [Ascoidea rubescens DSM 1968]ODV58572.1 Yip1-domain-containing protein [Ascoidea rubescens DSM 1968]
MNNQYYSNPMNSSTSNMASLSTENQLSTGVLAAFSTSGYPGEPSLLEELDINFNHIKLKTMAVLNPFNKFNKNKSNLASGDSTILNDSDLAGPIFFVLLFGVFLLLAGKIHFGYIYGCGLFGTLSLHWFLKLMASSNLEESYNMLNTNNNSYNFNQPPGIDIYGNYSIPQQSNDSKPEGEIKELDFAKSASIIGYCLLPLVFVSFLGVFISLDNFFGYLLGAICTVWSTYSASGFFVLTLKLQNIRFLTAYPLGLFYSIFTLMAIFVEKS